METSSLELFAIPFTCSLASHLALEEAGLPYTIHWMGRGPGKTLADGSPFETLSPSGKVPAIRLPDGTFYCENSAVLTAIASAANPNDAKPVDEHLRELEWISYIGTELHKQVLALCFDPDAPTVCKADAKTRLLPPVLTLLNDALTPRPHLLGDEPGLPDFYLFWALILTAEMKTDLAPFTSLTRFRDTMRARPAVHRVLATEMRMYKAAQASKS